MAARRRQGVRRGLAALAVVAALALTVVAVDRALSANVTERADARLSNALDASASALQARVAAAGAEADRLARSRSLQLALARHERNSLATIVARAGGHVVVRPEVG